MQLITLQFSDLLIYRFRSLSLLFVCGCSEWFHHSPCHCRIFEWKKKRIELNEERAIDIPHLYWMWCTTLAHHSNDSIFYHKPEDMNGKCEFFHRLVLKTPTKTVNNKKSSETKKKNSSFEQVYSRRLEVGIVCRRSILW